MNEQVSFGEMIANIQGNLNALKANCQIALKDLWEQIRARKDLPVIPAEWLESGANGTGYFDDVCELGSAVPFGVFFKGQDRYGRMVVVCRPVNGPGEVLVFFDRYREGAGASVICQQQRGGGAWVDCNGHSPRMYLALAEALSDSTWHNEKYEYDRSFA